MSQRTINPALPSTALILSGVVLLGVILPIENEWAVATILLVVTAAFAVTVRFCRFAGRLRTFRGDLPVSFGALLASGTAIALILYGHNFPLLMFATVLVWVLVALGLTVQFGFAGVINLGGAAFFGIGGYTAAVLGNAWPEASGLVLLVAAGLMSALVGGVLIAPLLRTHGHYSALITIAFGIMFATFMEVNLTFGGPQGLFVVPLQIAGFNLGMPLELGGLKASFYLNYAILTLLIVVAVLVAVKRLENSWVGLSMDFSRTDEVAAASFGLSVARARITAFLIGNFIIGIGGALYATMTGFVAPHNFTFGESLLMVAIIILGGPGNAWATLPAAALVILVPEKLQGVAEYRFLVFAAVVILVLRFLPKGLFPRATRTYAVERGDD